MTMGLVGRVREVCLEWRDGRPYRFPACCQLWYYLDVFRGRPPAVIRGAVDYGPCNAYVPCPICLRRPWRWRRPMTLHGPAEPPRYMTWEQACAELGISAEGAARYACPVHNC